MHDPMTQAFRIRLPWQDKYDSFITIWHVDPEKPGTGNRSDDSCGWFDRSAGPYADAVAYLLKDTSFMHEVRLTLERRVKVPYPFYEGISEEQLYGHRLPAGDALALVLMVATELELRRWWNGEKGNGGAHANWRRRAFTRRRNVVEFAARLALCSFDNLSSAESAESAIHLTAAALNRQFRPWYKHPRWHVWHWKLQVHPLQMLNRVLFHRCAKCRKGFKWGYSPSGYGDGKLYHGECIGHGCATTRVDPDGVADAKQGTVH